MANPNSLEAFDAKVRGYVDTNFSQYGIDWRERKRLGGPAFADYVRSKLAARLGPEDRWDARQRTLYTNLLRGSDILAKGVQNIDTKDTTFIQALGGDGTDDSFNAQRPENQQAPVAEGPDPAQAESDAISKTINDIVQRLSQPVIDPVTGQATDRIYDTLLKGGATAGMTSATMRGVGGPLAGANAVETANSAALPYLQQRESLLQSAVNLQNNRSLGLEDRRQGAAGLNLQQQQFNNGVTTNQWAADQNNQQGILGAIGGVGGAIIGGIAGGPQGAVAGAKTGAGLLAGAGSATAPTPAVKPVEPYKMFNKNKGVR